MSHMAATWKRLGAVQPPQTRHLSRLRVVGGKQGIAENSICWPAAVRGHVRAGHETDAIQALHLSSWKSSKVIIRQENPQGHRQRWSFPSQMPCMGSIGESSWGSPL